MIILSLKWFSSVFKSRTKQTNIKRCEISSFNLKHSLECERRSDSQKKIKPMKTIFIPMHRFAEIPTEVVTANGRDPYRFKF